MNFLKMKIIIKENNVFYECEDVFVVDNDDYVILNAI